MLLSFAAFCFNITLFDINLGSLYIILWLLLWRPLEAASPPFEWAQSIITGDSSHVTAL